MIKHITGLMCIITHRLFKHTESVWVWVLKQSLYNFIIRQFFSTSSIYMISQVKGQESRSLSQNPRIHTMIRTKCSANVWNGRVKTVYLKKVKGQLYSHIIILEKKFKIHTFLAIIQRHKCYLSEDCDHISRVGYWTGDAYFGLPPWDCDDCKDLTWDFNV